MHNVCISSTYGVPTVAVNSSLYHQWSAAVARRRTVGTLFYIYSCSSLLPLPPPPLTPPPHAVAHIMILQKITFCSPLTDKLSRGSTFTVFVISAVCTFSVRALLLYLPVTPFIRQFLCFCTGLAGNGKTVIFCPIRRPYISP